MSAVLADSLSSHHLRAIIYQNSLVDQNTHAKAGQPFYTIKITRNRNPNTVPASVTVGLFDSSFSAQSVSALAAY